MLTNDDLGENLLECVTLDRPDFWRTPFPSRTFHGRDIFAPVAAHLATGRTLQEVGSHLEDLRRLRWALPIADPQGLQGWIIHVDHFGNCITNIPRSLYNHYSNQRNHKTYVGSTVIQGGLQDTYAAVPEGEPVLLIGSSDYLEIAVHTGNAAELFGIRKGDPINLVFID